MVIPVDLDGYIFDCDHDYADTIKSYNILPAENWDTQTSSPTLLDKLTRALRKNRLSPFGTMIETATRLSNDQET